MCGWGRAGGWAGRGTSCAIARPHSHRSRPRPSPCLTWVMSTQRQPSLNFSFDSVYSKPKVASCREPFRLLPTSSAVSASPPFSAGRSPTLEAPAERGRQE